MKIKMLRNSQRNVIMFLTIGVVAGILLFLVDSRESHRSKFRSVQLGMFVGDAAKYLNDADGPLCAGAINRSASDCWFRDDTRAYRIVFDRNTGIVTAKSSWRRKPRSLLDRFCSRIGFSLPY